MHIIAILVSVAFAGLALLHVYWALGGGLDTSRIIPPFDGKPVFTPGPDGTIMVAAALAGFAAVSPALGFPGLVPVSVRPYLKWAGCAMGSVLVLRAIGEFRYMGFFKRVRKSPFVKKTLT